MSEIDPYAPPKAALDTPLVITAGGSELKVVGDKLITPTMVILPDRCVKCNEDSAGYRLKKTLYWHHPAFYLFLMGNILLYALVAGLARKKAVVTFALCPEHRSKRTNALLLGWGTTLVSFLGLFVLPRLDPSEAWPIIICVVGMVGGIAYVIIRGTALKPEKIDKVQAILRGCGKPFLASLSSRQ